MPEGKTYLDKNGTADNRFKMNHASDTSVGLRKTNGATLFLPFLIVFGLRVLSVDDGLPFLALVLVCVSKLVVGAPTAGAFPSAASTDRLGPYALSSRMVPAVPVGATFRPQFGGIAAV